MFGILTESSKRVMEFAIERANNKKTEPEHILLGIMMQDSSTAIEVLKKFNIDFNDLKAELENHIRQGKPRPNPTDPPPIPLGKFVVQNAIEESRALRDKLVGPEHLLLGLLRQFGSNIAKTLTKHGLNVENVRQEICRIRYNKRNAAKTSNALTSIQNLEADNNKSEIINIEEK